MPEWLGPKLLSWASILDEQTRLQALAISRLPIIAGHVALQADAHLGKGATVGSVIPTESAIIPSAVGVDIGCGMIASETNLVAADLPDNLDRYLVDVERVIPAGVGEAHLMSSGDWNRWISHYRWPDDKVIFTPGTSLDDRQRQTAATQFGTLGSGNHFFEVCLDEEDRVWVLLHSGSRGIGNQLARIHIDRAKKLKFDHVLEDPDLAYFVQGTVEFNQYMTDLRWSQEYAYGNRNAMMNAGLRSLFGFVDKGYEVTRINCHHNYSEYETHIIDGVQRKVWVTRKGAIRAEKGDLGLIPGSMGARSFIVRGLGNRLSFNSCAHGAGRSMSRSAAKKKYTVEDLAETMKGKSWLSHKAASLVDEIAHSYKDIDVVMEDQKDLVEIVHSLRQIANYKGA